MSRPWRPSSSTRSHRGKVCSRELKLALLLVLFIWMVYNNIQQYLNHKASMAASSSSSENNEEAVEKGYQILKLGRKDLNPQWQDLTDFPELLNEDSETTPVEYEITAENGDVGSPSNQERQITAENDDVGSPSNHERSDQEGEHEELEDLIDHNDTED